MNRCAYQKSRCSHLSLESHEEYEEDEVIIKKNRNTNNDDA